MLDRRVEKIMSNILTIRGSDVTSLVELPLPSPPPPPLAPVVGGDSVTDKWIYNGWTDGRIDIFTAFCLNKKAVVALNCSPDPYCTNETVGYLSGMECLSNLVDGDPRKSFH